MSRLRPATRSALRIGALAGCAGLMALGAAGCASQAGSGDGAGAAVTAPTSTAPVAAPRRSGPLTPGEQITATTDSPKAFATALKQHRAVVVAMLLRGVADDDYVGDALGAVRRRGPDGRGAEFFVYDVARQKGFGDLPRLLGITGTPAVVVIGRDGRLVNSWSGLVDEQMLRQAISAAKDATPG